MLDLSKLTLFGNRDRTGTFLSFVISRLNANIFRVLSVFRETVSYFSCAERIGVFKHNQFRCIITLLVEQNSVHSLPNLNQILVVFDDSFTCVRRHIVLVLSFGPFSSPLFQRLRFLKTLTANILSTSPVSCREN